MVPAGLLTACLLHKLYPSTTFVMNIVLINLTRFGDLLQSQAAITDLERQGHKVAVVCLANFAQAAALLRGGEHVFPFHGSELLKHVSESDRGLAEKAGGKEAARRNWHEALASLGAWRDALYENFTPDVVCNLTPSISARLLSYFIAQGKTCTGFGVDEHGFGHNGNSWATFLQGASLARGVSPFNVVDVFRMIARSPISHSEGLASTFSEKGKGDVSLSLPSDAEVLRMEKMLREQEPEGCSGFVAFQLGASEDRRRWPVESFVALGEILWREAGLCPVLLGSKAEKALAECYTVLAGHPCISMCGRTGIGELASLLRATRLLISNDTGTMHLAAGMRLPVLGIFLATAQPFDTGPYLEGSCCVEPDIDCHPCSFRTTCLDEEACRRSISPQDIAELALSYIREGEWRFTGKRSGCGSIRAWVSQYDEQGFMALQPLSGHGNSARAQWLRLQRHFIRLFLDRDRQCAFLPLAPGNFPAFSPEEGASILPVLVKSAEFIELLLQQGRVLLNRPMPVMRDRFLATWQKVYDSLHESIHGRALALLWVQETQADGQDLPVVLEVSGHFLSLLKAMMSQFIDLHDKK